MSKGRKRDPGRARRGTGNRPKPGELSVVPLPPQIIESEALRAPDDLPAGARPIWEQAVAELQTKGLTPADLEAIRLMCIQALRARQAAEMVERHGMIVEGARGPITNPALRIERDATHAYLRLAEQFGLTLAAKLRLGLMNLAGRSMVQALNDDLNQ